jgi:phosphoribosylanthranilate isomerase
MRVKICGMMRSEDVKVAIDSGADAVGFVVGSPMSPRNLALTKARKLMKSVPIFTARVAVTSANDSKSVLKICSKLRPDAIQLHQHRRELVRLIRRQQPETSLILATAIRNRFSVARASRTSAYSDAVLADTPNTAGMGGTGQVHNWVLTAAVRDRIYPHPLILAGGLTPRNVRPAIRKVKPFAVDVSTGVERKTGIKDHMKIMEFIKNAKGDMN